MPILLKLNANYADEFNCEEFAIIFSASIEQVQNALKRMCSFEEYIDEGDNSRYQPSERDVEMYFGTNEFLYGSDVLANTTISEISLEAAEVFMASLGIINRVRASAYPIYTFGTGVLSHIEDHLYADGD